MMKKIAIVSLILLFSFLSLVNSGVGKQQALLYSKYKNHSFDSLQINYNAATDLAINSFANEISMQNASIGFLLIDPSNQNIICDYNSDKALIPASTMKLFTTATALEVLGSDTSFTTWIEYSGNFDTEYGVLNGNIFIKGGGDPCLGSKAYNHRYYQPYFLEAWAKAIKDMGIHVINGDIIADELVFDTDMTPDGWNWIDIPAYYGSAASGLSIFENTYTLSIQPEAVGKYLVPYQDIKPFIPDFYVENHLHYSQDGSQYLDLIGSYYSNYRIVKGKIPKNKSEITIEGSIPDPPYLAAWYLKRELEKAGVKISGKSSSMRQLHSENIKLDKKRYPITSITSPKLSQIVTRTNLRSNNLYAEHLINHIAYTQTGLGSTSVGSAAIIKYWNSRGLNTEGMFVGDGSGLSRSNTLTSKQLVHLLYLMRKSKVNGQLYFESLPVSGVSGTLRKFATTATAKGRIHAKSGSMNRIKSYAGYIECKSGNELIFAFIVNNYNGNSSETRASMAKVLESVIQNN
jgi:serine-type D-Ala-D-Ala carboxypeptidase/endopeptidase (penicillin-binding protein 4)